MRRRRECRGWRRCLLERTCLLLDDTGSNWCNSTPFSCQDTRILHWKNIPHRLDVYLYVYALVIQTGCRPTCTEDLWSICMVQYLWILVVDTDYAISSFCWSRPTFLVLRTWIFLGHFLNDAIFGALCTPAATLDELQHDSPLIVLADLLYSAYCCFPFTF